MAIPVDPSTAPAKEETSASSPAAPKPSVCPKDEIRDVARKFSDEPIQNHEFSPPFKMMDGVYVGKGEDGSLHDHGAVDSIKAKAGKPPRCLPAMRHCASSTQLGRSAEVELEIGGLGLKSLTQDGDNGFLPVFRSGSCAEIGPKRHMEDEHICIDNLVDHVRGTVSMIVTSGAFYGVFDGHGGTDALKVDSSSGTTALTALVLGRIMHIANAGDCRAVLGKRGRVVELS